MMSFISCSVVACSISWATVFCWLLSFSCSLLKISLFIFSNLDYSTLLQIALGYHLLLSGRGHRHSSPTPHSFFWADHCQILHSRHPHHLARSMRRSHRRCLSTLSYHQLFPLYHYLNHWHLFRSVFWVAPSRAHRRIASTPLSWLYRCSSQLSTI